MLESFVVPHQEVEGLKQKLGATSIEALLRSLIGPASRWARTPTSKYHVGAVGLGASGDLFVGVNVELPGLPIGNSIHAEQFLVTNAWLHGERELKIVAVSAAPCGHCRQFFCELAKADSIQFLFGPPQAPPTTLNELLPLRFGPQDLLEDGSEPLLLEPRHNNLVLKDSPPSPSTSSLIEHALQGANRAYAPYTKCPSGCALRLHSSDKIYFGGCVESAAYNPTLPAFQAALIHAISDQAFTSFQDIASCALVEADGAIVRTESTLRHLLSILAPSAQLTVALAVKAEGGEGQQIRKSGSAAIHVTAVATGGEGQRSPAGKRVSDSCASPISHL